MKDYICSIDIGSSLVRVLVARTDDTELVEVIGVGSAPSRGVKNGVIVNIDATIQSVTEAAREAELMSGLVVEDARVNVTGRHLHGENSRGVIAVTNRDRVVKEADVLRVIEGAQNIRIPSDQEIIHVLSREFIVDDQSGVRDPVGMTGIRLEADVHIVTAGSTALSNLQKAISGAGIRIQDGVMGSLAAAEGVLNQGEKDLGTAVVDIGGGTIEIVMYIEGGVYYSSVLPLGGIHVTQDLSIGLKVPMDRAEMVKKTYGACLASAVDPTEKIELPGIHGRPSRRVLRQQIAEIIEPRMHEIFEMIDSELVRSGRKDALTGGVVLAGGGCLIEGAMRQAEDILGLPVTLGMPVNVSGFTDRVSGPEFATSVGLLHYGGRFGGRSEVKNEKRKSGSFIDTLKNWISENL